VALGSSDKISLRCRDFNDFGNELNFVTSISETATFFAIDFLVHPAKAARSSSREAEKSGSESRNSGGRIEVSATSLGQRDATGVVLGVDRKSGPARR